MTLSAFERKIKQLPITAPSTLLLGGSPSNDEMPSSHPRRFNA